MWFHIKQILIAIDQLLNTLLFGWPDETLSSRCWRLSLSGNDLPRKIVDTILFFDKDHCKSSYESEKIRNQCPPELRVK